MTVSGTIACILKVAVLFGCSTAFATTIVAVTTNNGAYLGADSRGRGTNEPICKVVEANGVAVGMSGHLADTATQFNAGKQIAATLARSATLKAAVQDVIAELEGPLGRSIEWGKVNAPAEYTANYEGKKVLELLFIGVVNNKPQIAVLVWWAQNGRIRRDEPKYLGGMQSLVVGTHDAVAAYQEKHPNWVTLPAMTIISTFLSIEAKQEPTLVGPPFSVVQISSAGTHWVRTGACNSSHSNK